MGVTPGLSGLYHSWHTNYRHASHLYHVLFSTQTGTLCRATSGSGSLLHSPMFGCIPANKPSIASCFSCALTVLFSCLEHSVEEVLTADLSAHVVGAGRLLIVRSTNNNTGPNGTKTELGYKLKCTRRGMVGRRGTELIPFKKSKLCIQGHTGKCLVLLSGWSPVLKKKIH